MRRIRLILATIALVASCVGATAADVNMDWAYHDDNDGTDDRFSEAVPGQAYMFVGNAKKEISTSEPITLYVLTGNQFAGDAEEQVFVRWWNGMQENWVAGSWETNVRLGPGEMDAGRFHGLPAEGDALLDIWKIVIPAEMTEVGENFYVIQIKGWSDAGASEKFLLRDTAEGGSNNNVGQAWTAGSYFEHDWSVTITE